MATGLALLSYKYPTLRFTQLSPLWAPRVFTPGVKGRFASACSPRTAFCRLPCTLSSSPLPAPIHPLWSSPSVVEWGGVREAEANLCMRIFTPTSAAEDKHGSAGALGPRKGRTDCGELESPPYPQERKKPGGSDSGWTLAPPWPQASRKTESHDLQLNLLSLVSRCPVQRAPISCALVACDGDHKPGCTAIQYQGTASPISTENPMES